MVSASFMVDGQSRCGVELQEEDIPISQCEGDVMQFAALLVASVYLKITAAKLTRPFTVLFKLSDWQRLETTLDMKMENGTLSCHATMKYHDNADCILNGRIVITGFTT